MLGHSGVPDWMAIFKTRDFPRYFAGYAAEFRFAVRLASSFLLPQRDVCCVFFPPGTDGGHEQLQTSRAFVTALKHHARANVLRHGAILNERPDAIFVTERIFGNSSRGKSAAIIKNAQHINGNGSLPRPELRAQGGVAKVEFLMVTAYDPRGRNITSSCTQPQAPLQSWGTGLLCL